MKRRLSCSSVLVLVVLLLAPGAWGDLPEERPGEVSVPAEEPLPPVSDEDGRDWEFLVAPYIFLPFMEGDARVGNVSMEVSSTVSDAFSKSDFVFALSAEIEAWHRRKWGLAFNGMWAVLEKNDNTLPGPLPTQFDLKMNMGLFEFLGLYSFGERSFGPEPGSSTWTFQPLLGARVTTMQLDLDFTRIPDVEKSRTWADPILGARTMFRFGNDNRWNWTLRGDVGGFGAGSEITWNLVGLLGYDFHIGSVPSRVLLGARGFYQDYREDDFEWRVAQYGPVLGLALLF